MSETNVENKFGEWCFIELFGHKKIVGFVSEANIGAGALLRVDLHKPDGEMDYTRYYHPNAIYSMTPINKDVALSLSRRFTEPPIQRWELPQLKAAEDKGWNEEWEAENAD